jgi:hypothetical protein
VAIDCSHPRPLLNLPGHTTPRLRWAVPAVIPGIPPDAARVLRQALQGIYDEMLDRFSSRTVVPLLDNPQQLRNGQIVRGVANGETLVMPLDAPGTQDGVTVVLTDVTSPVTIVYPDGTTDTLSTPGVYEFEPSGDAPAWATTALASGSVPIGSLAPIADETLIANISGGVASPVALPFATIDSASVIWDSASDTFQRAAMSGAIVAAQNSGATVFAGILDNGAAENNRTNLNFIAGTNTTATVTDDAGNDELEIRFNVDDFPISGLADQADDTFLANISGAPAPPTAVALTTLAGAGLTGGADAILNVGAGTRITVNANDVQLAAGAAETFLGNFTASSAVADYRAGTSVAGAGLTYTAGGTLAVGSSTSITVNADDVQRSALTGDITAALNVNTTAFRTFTARSVLANATNASAVPTELQGGTAHQLLKVNSAGTALVFEGMTLAAFPTIADDTFLANISGGAAVPTAVALTTLAGAGLTGGANAVLAVGAGTRITVNADDVQLAAGAAESFLMNATAGSAVADYRAGSSVAGAGLTYTAGGTLAVGAGTNVTVNANDVAVTDFPLTGLATQAAGTVVANITAGAAAPTAHALSTLAGGGLTYTNVTGIMAVGAGTGITVNANDVQLTTIADDTFMANVSGGAAVATGKTFASLAGLGIEYDATNHELDVTLTDLDSTSIVVSSSTFVRAALTGAIAASQNSNATLFAGIRDNGSAETDRTNLNFVSSTSATAVVTDDAGNDELEVTFQRAALTGEVTASANANALTIDKTITPTWTGTHTFSGGGIVCDSTVLNGPVRLDADVRFNGVLSTATTGAINNLAIGNSNVIRFTGGSAVTLSGMVPNSNGQSVFICAVGTSVTLIRAGSTSTNLMLIPHTSLTLDVDEGALMWYDSASSRWRLISTHNSL